ncbi:helix-turn-helix domain-containing protein [Companilactobacillus nuruki]|uniref:HTH cro/C1-type domain-containing protein n=1 Tax=Companilactobacillus nuruki TaxID=1993540 RepID=A0A2N7AVS9_9LACO|nr:helix-turn-helix transcriptional regulator [Companilactobacillus nuruki]PMD72280.1 hypothetical protein CBP76_03850 [Companilactobacillus nuruki]
MALSDNIVKYREKNGMTQEQLAESLRISRQSISKWELGQNLPSIDNLISLSGLLDISLDELITGEPYLHFPFDYGKPKSKASAIILAIIVVFWMLMGGIFGNIGYSFMFGSIFYILIVWIYPFDFKKYYNYWTLEKRGIRYLVGNKEVYSSWENIIMPIKALLHIRSTNFVEYKQMTKVEIKVDLFGYQPKKVVALGNYAPGSSQLMNESFVMKITTKDGKEVYLDLKSFYWHQSIERQMLPTILMFLKRKNVEFVDRQGIIELIKDRDVHLVDELYKRREETKKIHAD